MKVLQVHITPSSEFSDGFAQIQTEQEDGTTGWQQVETTFVVVCGGGIGKGRTLDEAERTAFKFAGLSVKKGRESYRTTSIVFAEYEGVHISDIEGEVIALHSQKS